MALNILDARLAGQEMKELVGTPGLSVYKVKRVVQQIKALAHEFAERLGDPGFLSMVAGAMDAERATVAKRQQALAARQTQ